MVYSGTSSDTGLDINASKSAFVTESVSSFSLLVLFIFIIIIIFFQLKEKDDEEGKFRLKSAQTGKAAVGPGFTLKF